MLKSQKGNAELVMSIIITLVVMVLIWIGQWIWNSYSCSTYGDLTDRTTKYSVVSGCFVKTSSGWIPQEEMSKRAYGNSITETEASSKEDN